MDNRKTEFLQNYVKQRNLKGTYKNIFDKLRALEERNGRDFALFTQNETYEALIALHPQNKQTALNNVLRLNNYVEWCAENNYPGRALHYIYRIPLMDIERTIDVELENKLYFNH